MACARRCWKWPRSSTPIACAAPRRRRAVPTKPRPWPSVLKSSNASCAFARCCIPPPDMSQHPGAAMNTAVLRQHAEHQFAEELEQLKKIDNRQRPANWQMSPWAVVTYLVGGKLDNGYTVTPKYIGNRRLMEIAVATVATDRALLLFGV